MSLHSTEGEQPDKKILFPKHLLELPAHGQTIIHGFAPGLQQLSIDPGTVLITRVMGERLKLIFAYGIPMHPESIKRSDHCFTLIFESLPEGCEHFHISEKPDETGGYHLSAIPRRPDDVYWLPFIW